MTTSAAYTDSPIGPVPGGVTFLQSLQGWFASVAGRQSACTSVVCIGTSITMGQGATAFANTWCQRLAAGLRNQFGVTGGGRGWLNPQPHSLTTWTPPYVTVSGAPAEHDGSSPQLSAWNFTTAGQQWVYSLNGDSADIMWVGATGFGTFSYQVDAGTVTNVSTSVPYTDGQITHVSLGSAGAHTLTIAWVSGSPVYLDGVREYNGDFSAGLQVQEAGYLGSTSSGWTSSTADPKATPAAIAALKPGLLVIELGANDSNNGISAAAFQSNLTTLIAHIRATASWTGAPILLLGTYCPQPLVTPANWQGYINAMYAVAAGDPLIGMLDLTLRMPASQASQTWGLYATDNIHPSDKGHQMIADAISDFLGPA